MIRKVEKITERIADALRVTGPLNVQYLAQGTNVKVIEANLRASRSFPFVSKICKVNFIELATKAILDSPCAQQSVDHGTASTMSALKLRTFRSRDCKARIQPWESRWLLRAKLAAWAMISKRPF